MHRSDQMTCAIFSHVVHLMSNVLVNPNKWHEFAKQQRKIQMRTHEHEHITLLNIVHNHKTADNIHRTMRMLWAM